MDIGEKNLEEYPVSRKDPGGPLEDDERWVFWQYGEGVNLVKGRFRAKKDDPRWAGRVDEKPEGKEGI